VELELDCLAAEALARLVAAAPLGVSVAVAGFLAAKSKSTRRLALHVTDIQFREKE
jgi:primosomal replication protein N